MFGYVGVIVVCCCLLVVLFLELCYVVVMQCLLYVVACGWRLALHELWVDVLTRFVLVAGWFVGVWCVLVMHG